MGDGSNRPLRSLIIGAGGVTSSVIFAIDELNDERKIYILRTEQKNVEDLIRNGLKEFKTKPKVLDWGDIPKNLDIIVNTTSVGLAKDENLKLDFSIYKNSKKNCFL